MSGWIAWHEGALLLMLRAAAPMSPALLPQKPLLHSLCCRACRRWAT